MERRLILDMKTNTGCPSVGGDLRSLSVLRLWPLPLLLLLILRSNQALAGKVFEDDVIVAEQHRS